MGPPGSQEIRPTSLITTERHSNREENTQAGCYGDHGQCVAVGTGKVGFFLFLIYFPI